jgi:hypothetical protein
MDKETEEYLAKIRKTVEESKRMVESAKLRFAETDRMLEECGTSREEVMKMRFTPEQKEAVSMELGRRGVSLFDGGDESPVAPFSASAFDPSDIYSDMENRRRKFGTMMKSFRM